MNLSQIILPVITTMWVIITGYNLFWATRIYRIYFAYAHWSMKGDWEKGFSQSQDWFWANDVLCMQSAVPFYWFWRCRKASDDLNAIIETYPHAAPIPPA